MPAQDNFSSPVTEELDRKGTPYRVFRHSGELRSLEQAARERHQRPEQVVRSILFRLADDEFVMVLVGGPGRLSWQSLREYLKTSRMTMASEEEVLAVTGYQPGAVSPFGLPGPIRILLDRGLHAEEEVSLGSGVRGTAVIIKLDDLLEALAQYEEGNFLE
ncbi:MAG: YbaK/EbsC family protein [Chloroflexi bacterium]|nr:MAG: YbaK/EbsC family protein [Chloroflexota bacterium]